MAKRKKPKAPVPTGPGLCRLCPRHAETPVVCMPGYGPSNPTLVAVAESPATTEDVWCRVCQRPGMERCWTAGHARGQPLVGPSGELLKRALQFAGFNPAEVFYTNVVRCSGGNPPMTHVRKCMPYLMNELLALDYSRCVGVVIFGEIAVHGILNDGRIKLRDIRLRTLNPFMGFSIPSPVRATYHPAAALSHRDPTKYDEIVGDLRDLLTPRGPLGPIEHVTDPTVLLDRLHDAPVVSLDLEWYANGTIRIAGLATDTHRLTTPIANLLTAWSPGDRPLDALPGGVPKG